MKAKDDVLKRWMQEHFPYSPLRKAGFFTKEMRGDYEAQAKRVCHFYGLESVYEWGEKEIRCHITYAGERPEGEGFVTVIPSVWDEC